MPTDVMASTLKFQAQATNGRPRIFWEESNQANAQKKKFDYKKKEQPFSLRNKKATPNPPAQKKIPSNQPPIQKAVPKSNAKSKIDTGIKKKEDPPKPDPNMVTLTQKEFDAILETIGKLALEAEGANHVESFQNNVANGGDTETKVTGDEAVETLENHVKDRDPGGTVATGIDRNSKGTTNPSEEDPLPLPPSPNNRAQQPIIETSANRGNTDQTKDKVSVDVQHPTITQPLVPQNEERGLLDKPPLPADSKPVPIPIPLSKAELKKLQWQKERAEIAKLHQSNWDPWGKPGGGAPVKDQHGNTLADYNARKDQPSDHSPPHQTQHAWPQNASNMNEINSSHLAGNALLVRQSLEDVTNIAPPGPPKSHLTSTAPVVQSTMSPRQQADIDRGGAPPAAIRSSFTVGAIAPDEDRFSSAKDRQKKTWLEELEKQREEQRQRKLQEKALKNKEELHDTWADRFTTVKPTGIPEQRVPLPHSTVNEATQAALTSQTQAYGGTDEERVNSAPLSTRVDQPISDMENSTYLRGQNAFVDPYLRKEFDEKRRKQLEHQQFIKNQIEERERQKREEREKRIKEEMEEEAKFKRERDMLANQVEKAHQKTRDKEEAEGQRLDAMKAAMDEAKAEAEREKLENRLRKLQKAGHDVSQLERTYEAKGITPRVGASSLVPQAHGAIHVEPSYIPGLHPTPRDAHHVEPGLVPGLELSQGAYSQTAKETYLDNAAPTTNYYKSPRDEDHGHGVHTDGQRMVREDSTEIEYKGPIKERRKVRVKSAPKENRPSHGQHTNLPDRENRGSSKSKEKSQERRKAYWELNEDEVKKAKGTVSVNERPRWGAPTKKKVVKQSERDPNYERRKNRIEASRKQRQMELQALAAKNAHKIPVTQTVSSRNRSRSRDRDSSGDRGRSVSPPGPHIQQQGNRRRSPAPEPRPLPPEDDFIESHRSRADGHKSTRQRSQKSNHSPGAAIGSQSPHMTGLMLRLRPESPEQANPRRSYSPPIPAIKHRTNVDYNVDPYSNDAARGDDSQRSTGRNKYGDINPLHPPISDGDFVPFLRTNDILDPVHAESPLPVSREPSAVTRGRKAYVHEQYPAEYGNQMRHFSDKRLKDMVSPAPAPPQPEADRWVNPNAVETKDPLYNPSLVTENPSTRQGQILQQLSSLRRGLMQKQRELEVGLPGPAEITGEDY